MKPHDPSKLTVSQVAAVMRRIVADAGPLSQDALRAAARASLEGAVVDERQRRHAMDMLLSNGDLFEWPPQPSQEPTLLHCSPLRVVRRPAGGFLLIGVDPRLEANLEIIDHEGRRWVRDNGQGLPEVAADQWARAPTRGALMAAPQASQHALEGAPGLGLDNDATFLDRGGAYARQPLRNAPAGVHVAARSTLWGGRQWYLIDVNPPGYAARAIALPVVGLPCARAGFEQAWTVHIALAYKHGQPCRYSLDGDALTLRFPAPPWLARLLDLCGDRKEGVRSWTVQPGLHETVRKILEDALMSTA